MGFGSSANICLRNVLALEVSPFRGIARHLLTYRLYCFISHSVDCSVVVKELHENNISTCALRDDGVKFCIYWGSHKRAKSNRKKEKF